MWFSPLTLPSPPPWRGQGEGDQSRHGQDPQFIEQLQLVILNNQGISFENGLALAGVDDFWEGPARASEATKNLSPDSVIIMLSHNPDINIQLKGDEIHWLVLKMPKGHDNE